MVVYKACIKNFPGSPGVKTSPSNAGPSDSIPGQEAKIPHALRPEKQHRKQKQFCSKFNQDFKNGSQKERKKEKETRKHSEKLIKIATYRRRMKPMD